MVHNIWYNVGRAGIESFRKNEKVKEEGYLVIEVLTLGDFDIKIDKNSVLVKSCRANKN